METTKRKHSNGENTIKVTDNKVYKEVIKNVNMASSGNLIPIFDLIEIPYTPIVYNWGVKKQSMNSGVVSTNMEIKKYKWDLKQYVDNNLDKISKTLSNHHTRYLLYFCDITILQMIYLSSKGILIHDIKPSNVFLDITDKYIFSVIGDNEYSLISDGQVGWCPYKFQYEHDLEKTKLRSSIYTLTLRSLIYRFVNMVLGYKIPPSYVNKFKNLIPQEGQNLSTYIATISRTVEEFLKPRDLDDAKFLELKNNVKNIVFVEDKQYKPYLSIKNRRHIRATKTLKDTLELFDRLDVNDMMLINMVTGLGDSGYGILNSYNIENFPKQFKKCQKLFLGRKCKIKKTFV